MYSYQPHRIKKICDYTGNSALGLRNLVLRRLKPASLKPRWIWFEVTDRCNSRCRFCNVWQKPHATDPLTLGEIEKAFSDNIFKDVEYVINSGGEPVIREDLEEILLIEKKLFPKATLQLSTNGLLPERMISLVKAAIRNSINIDVGVSVDAIGEEHDSIRGVKGNFKKVDRLLNELIMLEKFCKNKMSITIGSTLCDLTVGSFEEIRVYAERLKVNFMVHWYNSGPFYNNIKNENLISRKDLLIKRVSSLASSVYYEKWIKSLCGEPIRFPCFALCTFCVLKCNGDMAPCLTLFDAAIGNVREESPTRIWNSLEAGRVRSLVRDCRGCVNSWGVGWSFASSFYPYLLFHFKHPIRTMRKFINR